MKDNETIDNKKRIKRITTTSKRQITIPKSFFEILYLKEGDQLDAYLVNDKIMLVPVKKEEAVFEEDRNSIIKNTIDEGFTGDELAKELSKRLAQYDELIYSRVAEFENDIREEKTEVSELEDFNGLEIFFDKKAGKDAEKAGE